MNTQKYTDRLDTYILQTDEIAAGSNKLMFDLFNNTAADSPPHNILLLGWFVAPKTDVAVTGVVSARFDMFRTSTVGTGGTTSSFDAPASNAINISRMNSGSMNIANGNITARSQPSGGAALGAWLNSIYAFPEETNAASILQQYQNILPDSPQIEPFCLRRGEGVVVKQGTVASLNSYIFTLVFAVAQIKG